MLINFGVWIVSHITTTPTPVLVEKGLFFLDESLDQHTQVNDAHQGNLQVEIECEVSTCMDLAGIHTAELCLTRSLEKALMSIIRVVTTQRKFSPEAR